MEDEEDEQGGWRGFADCCVSKESREENTQTGSRRKIRVTTSRGTCQLVTRAGNSQTKKKEEEKGNAEFHTVRLSLVVHSAASGNAQLDERCW